MNRFMLPPRRNPMLQCRKYLRLGNLRVFTQARPGAARGAILTPWPGIGTPVKRTPWQFQRPVDWFTRHSAAYSHCVTVCLGYFLCLPFGQRFQLVTKRMRFIRVVLTHQSLVGMSDFVHCSARRNTQNVVPRLGALAFLIRTIRSKIVA